jgi:hypothetical protein
MKTGKRLFDRLELSRTIIWSIATRCWQLVGGMVSFVLVAERMSEREQGYYVTFWSLVALQSMIDLGLSIVVTNFSSHEWAFLHLDSSGAICGDKEARSRLVSLGRMSGLWFLFGAILFVMIAGLAGSFLFASKGDSDILWQWPWLATILASGISLWCLPFFSLLEGCGQMEAAYRFRMFQAINTNFCVWAVLLAGGGLWAAAASATFRCLTDLLFIVVKYRVFFRPFRLAPEGAVLSWRSDIWPVQWRLAAGGLLSYFSYFLFAPVLFHFHSEKLAGQMGMTRQLLITLQSAAQSWIQTRVPEFSRLIAKREFHALDHVFFRVLSISTGFLSIGGVLFLFGLVGLQELAPQYAGRLLPVTPTMILLLGMIFFQLPFGQTLYLRAHRKEPVFLETLASNFAIAAGVWFAGRAWAANGAAAGYLLAVMLVTVPGIHMAWLRFRRHAHSAV